jgi:hypothetical protein
VFPGFELQFQCHLKRSRASEPPPERQRDLKKRGRVLRPRKLVQAPGNVGSKGLRLSHRVKREPDVGRSAMARPLLWTLAAYDPASSRGNDLKGV